MVLRSNGPVATGALIGAVLFAVFLGQQFAPTAGFLTYTKYVTESISNRSEFVNKVLSDEIKLRIVDHSVYVYDWDHDTLKISGKWVLKSQEDDAKYYVEYTQKIDKETAFKGILENLNANDQITDIKRVERAKPQTYTFEKTFSFW
ncbi:uncharacterized protein LOC131207098 [Anopheles bellator]|uniref:uncharacterized protein LOC131207098 n=1 Tax=Anopheles bellator TaxID=139047 RepID=UPI002648FAD3|nr:uncharacterized protein LOC131207098 [Anopheles bellator]